MQAAAQRMAQEDWLTNYRDPDFLDRIVDRTARRLRRPELLTGGGRELWRHREAWEADFQAFWPEVTAFARMEMADLSPASE